MKKQLLFFLCITTLSYAMEPANHAEACAVILYAAMRETTIRENAARATNTPIHLVVGSNRCSAILHGCTKDKLLAELYCEEKADLTHTKTYGGKAITIDILPSAVPRAPHIIGDAMQFRFPKNSIENAYLERFSTVVPDMQLYLTDKEQYKNHLGKCIQNIGKSMISGGKIIIEWDPSLSLYCRGVEHSNNMYNLYDPNTLREDPFTADIDVNIAWIGTSMEIVNHVPGAKESFKLEPNLSKDSIRCIKELSTTIRILLNFYEKQRPGARAKISRHIDTEFKILRLLLNAKPKQVAILFCSPLDGMKNFHSANHETYTTILADHPLVCDIQDFPYFLSNDPLRSISFFNAFTQDNPHFTIPFKGAKTVIYDSNSFLSDSLFFRILAQAFTLHKGVQANVKEFMHNNGFKDIEIATEATSPCNGRKNVRLITATKI